MKKLFILFILIFNLYGKTNFSNSIYKGVENVLLEQYVELNEHLNIIKIKEINLALYTSGEYIEEKEKLLKVLEEKLLTNPKIKIINYGDILNGDVKNAYVLKLDFSDTKYTNHFGLKKQFFGISTLELLQKEQNTLSFSSYKPLNVTVKISNYYGLFISLGLLIIGLIISFATKKYYTFQIMSISGFLVVVFNIYFFIFL